MIELPLEEIEEMMADECWGICIDCHYIQSGVEPYAEDYTCESCGAKSVMGIEMAIILMELGAE